MPLTPASSKYAIRPVQRIAAAAANCRTEGAAYGACIMADYNHVFKDKCATEFLKLKECYLMNIKKAR